MELQLTNTTFKNKLIDFIKWCIIQLLCNNNVEHRNYSSGHIKQSKFEDIMKTTNNLELTIEQIVNEIIDSKLIKTASEIYKVNNELNIETLDDDNSDPDSDDDYEKYDCIFNEVINFIGIWEIFNIHHDNLYEFEDKFMKIIKEHENELLEMS